MAPITVEPKVLADAAGLYDKARGSASGVMTALVSALDGGWGSAGTDNAGHSWSTGYDPAAFDAVKAGGDVVNAFAKLHDLLACSGVNHANAEGAAKSPPDAPLPAPALAPGYTVGSFKGAYGGDTDAPLGWGLISRWLEGHLWPNGDPDKLRKLSTAWDDAAKGMRSASDISRPSRLQIEGLSSPDLTKARAQIDLVANEVELLAYEYEQLGRACLDWAEKIEDAHTKIRHIIRDTIGWALVAGVIGGIVGSLIGPEGTVGGATLAASADAMEAAAQIRPILIALDAAAGLATGAVAAGVVGVGVAAIGVTKDLQPLLQANASIYDAEGGTANVPTQGPTEVKINPRQLQKKFKHASDFGIDGNYNPENAGRFEKAITDLVTDPKTQHIYGSYRGEPTIINVNPDTGLAVLQRPSGEFLSGWKLTPEQLANVLQRGSL